eukprot:1944149-Amphidinium_carterae.2
MRRPCCQRRNHALLGTLLRRRAVSTNNGIQHVQGIDSAAVVSKGTTVMSAGISSKRLHMYEVWRIMTT